MLRTGFGVICLAIGVAAAFPARGSAQALGPTDSDLYCAGFFTSRPLDAMTVLGGESGGLKNEFSDRDIIYLSRGQGASPGSEFMVVRPIRDPSARESFPGQRLMMMRLGTLYSEIARIQVRIVHEGSLTAEVVRACESIVSGDLAIPLTPRSAPAYRLPKVTDRFAPASGKPTGLVVAAREFQQNVGEGKIVYLNLGRNQGAQVGSYLRVFRAATDRAQDPFEQAAREYPTAAMGQQMGRQLTRAEVASLPRVVLGEVMLLAVEEGSSTGIVTFSREEISLGDQVELE
jgi:hypothetical protein